MRIASCALCGIKLAPKEAFLCHTCLAFIIFKYGSLKKYDHAHFCSERGGKRK